MSDDRLSADHGDGDVEHVGAASAVCSLSHREKGGVRGSGLSAQSGYPSPPPSPQRGEGAHRVRGDSSRSSRVVSVESTAALS